jgi:branched-chain amino acid transport system ATP-binding protein
MMLDVRHLTASYGQHRALEDAHVKVGKGEIVVILGANGAGKSTLLKSIAGICEGQVSGEVVMDGIEITAEPPHRIVEHGLALVPEGRGIFADLTVEENLRLGAYSERARDEEAATLERVLTLFPKLGERRRQVVRTMSGGEQQMVAIGRAMMSNPQILMLDEPSLGLAPMLCRELFQSLKAVRDSGLGILLVEQNAKQSLAIAERGYLLENGEIVHEDMASSLLSDPAVQKAYLGGGGAAAPVTHRGAAGPEAVRKSPPAAPRPAGPSPSDIAAAEMQKFAKRAPLAAPISAPAAPQRWTEPRPAAPEAQPAPPREERSPDAPRATGQEPGGIRIDDLVTRATQLSSARPPRQPMNGGTVKPTTPSFPMPDLGESRDRLRAALKEIEEAAARARAYRPPRKE